MDQDILVLTESYFEEFFADRITNQDRDDIKQWLTIQLQQERQGWKNKLNMSLKEVERERRVALENQTALQNVHSLLMQFTQTYGPILSLDSSKNVAKSSMAKQVEYYAHHLFDLVNHFEEERVKCFDLLNLKDYQQMYLFEALKAHIEHLRDRIKDIQSKAADTERNLKEELENISNNLNEEKRKHELEEARLNRMIQMLREELEKLKLGSPVLEEKSPPVLCDVAVQVEAWSICKTKDSEVQTEPLNYDPERNKTETSVKTDVEPQSHPVTSVYVKEKNVKLHKLDIGAETDGGNSNTNLSDSLHLSSINGEDQELVNTNIHENMERQFRKRARKEKNRYNSKADDLRNQVVNYAEKLDKAKVEMDIYQQQLVGFKVTPRPAPYKPSYHGGVWHTSSQDYPSSKDPSAFLPGGFLGGVQKDLISTSRDRNIVATLHANSRKGLDYNKSTSSCRCLRCHRNYKVRDNNPLACRFHPKSKKKLEKYDNAGRLIKMAYRWECCHQKAESTGCCSGEHI